MKILIILISFFFQHILCSINTTRMNHIFQSFLIVTVGLLFFIQPAFGQETQSKKIGTLGSQENLGVTFAFIHNYPIWGGPEVTCLSGAFKSGLHSTLLHKNYSSVCTAKTGAQKIDTSDLLGDLTFTLLVELNNCSNPDEYSVAVVDSKVKSYEVIHLRELKDQATIRVLDQKVRSTRVLQELLDSNGPSHYLVDRDILKALPKVFAFPMQDKDAYVVEYTLSSDGIVLCGPRVMVVKGAVHGLTGQCSYPYVRMFRMNDQSYIESGSFCCGCGVTGQEIFRIEETGPVLVYDDYSFSD